MSESEGADQAESDDDSGDGYEAHFAGPCTCDHDEEQHGWGSCDVDGCSCEAGWEE